MRILVTGGAGYIGSVVVARLISADHEVTVFDNLRHGHPGAVHPNAHLVVGDLSDFELLSRTLREFCPHAVMHFAAFIEAGESMHAPERYFRNNTSGTLTLLEAMLANRINTLVFSSTAALYGTPKRTPIEETSELTPTNAYGESKLLVERILKWFHQIHGLKYASLRYFNAAGSNGHLGEDHSPETHLIPLALKVALGQSDSISIFGTDYPTPDGTCIRDYIHVLDLAVAHLLALDALSTRGCLIYNLGNSRGYSVREVLGTVRSVTGHPIPVVESDRRAGDPPVLIASAEKIQRELGWKPHFDSLEKIVRSAWEWKRQHPNGYGGLP
jgi:UDP-glucose 4-epimerase